MTRKELVRHELRMREDSGSFRAAALAILLEVIRTYEIIAERLDGNPIPTPTVPPLAVRGGPAVASGDSLATLLAYWKPQKVRRPRTVDEAELAVREFERINGTHPGFELEIYFWRVGALALLELRRLTRWNLGSSGRLTRLRSKRWVRKTARWREWRRLPHRRLGWCQKFLHERTADSRL